MQDECTDSLREIFLNTIEDIRKVLNFDDELNNLIERECTDGYVYPPNCVDSTITLLQYLLRDENDAIPCFIFELEFGKTWEPGSITDKEGNDIDLSSAEKLFDYLLSQYQKD